MKLLIAMAGLLAFAAESSAAQCRYEVVVQTGDRTNAGTDARVSLQVSSATNGSKLFVPNLESWGEMYADHDYFEKGNLDRFGGNGPCMPYQPLDMVITSDGSGNKPSCYNDETIFDTEEVMDGFISAVETFYFGDYDKQSQVLNEDLHRFKDRVGHFSKHVALAGCKDFDFSPAKWWGNYGTQVPTLQKMAIRILSLTSSASGCERNWSCFEGIHTKKRNRLTCERLEQLVFVRFNNLNAKKKEKAKKNKLVDPLLSTEATCAQGWIVEGEEVDDGTDVEPITGLTWKLIAETCGAEEVTKLRRSVRLNQAREIEDDIEMVSEEEPMDEEDIDFESGQEDVVVTGYESGNDD